MYQPYSRRLEQIEEKKQPEEVISHSVGDYEYLNITIPFNNQLFLNGKTDGIVGSPATFNETRLTPLFDGSPSDYKLSVVRWQLPLSLVPIQIINIFAGINDTFFSVMISYGALQYFSSVIWKTQNNLARIPGSSAERANNKQNYDNYFSLYSYNHLVNLINIALQDATNLAILDGVPLTKAPFLVYNGETKLFVLYAPIEFNSNAPNPIKLNFNNYLYNIFANSFPFIENLTTPPILDISDLIYEFIITPTLINQILLGTPTHNYVILEQEFSTLSLISQLASIIITTKTIPTRSEGISTGSNIGQSTANTLTILTDFIIDMDDPLNRNEVIYNPTAQYRYITLNSRFPIINIDVTAFWRDINNILRPIYIPPNGEGSIKILFERK